MTDSGRMYGGRDKMSEYINTIVWFSRLMELKLIKNRNKGGWSECDTYYLLGRLQEEVDELRNEIELSKTAKTQGRRSLHLNRIWGEAADVANFALMIADNNPPQLKDKPCPIKR